MRRDDIGRLAETLNYSSPKKLSIDGFRGAAVLVPLVETGNGYDLLFTKRTESVDTHKGQISFPGGMVDGTDRDVVHTALRETEEEIGISAENIRVLGILDDIATPIGFVITPVVGVVTTSPVLSLNSVEVAEVFQAPLAFFAEPGNGTMRYREADGRRYEVWSFDTGRHVIWGATANIVRMLLAKLPG